MACARKFLFRVLQNNNLALKRSLAMSQTRRAAEEAVEKLKESNPYYWKYAEKIAKIQQTSAEEFLDRVERVVNPIKDGQSQARSYSELLNPKQELDKKQDAAELPHKKLSDIMKLELLADKSAEDLSQIWIEYHKTKEVLAATLTTAQYDTLMCRAKEHPIFLLPLPRSEGFEFFLLQFAANTVHFTPLLAYQVHHENAPECLTVVHYTEVQDKGVVLMRGEYDSKVLTAQEAQCLANELQMFYYKTDESKMKLLETFTKRPDEFKHTDLIKEVENIQLA
ncbi:ATP synthase mitochondrial F1 complex assembly factor 1 [Drosophila guanche]|uniref:Blast:ATP synthase mitochondrial F1 complex assembly factor 1 n=1 Tax=Drosophila guanche TaxID=7266 RepID=A0A3B0JJE4_DROGU|nr:ATP synthase mitochondrial F1 complex assembly factor 1 [Drosophila guanche]SPP80452.1 blast:ATP synthase mitochondrial F1 complex assembly factor 1 [Drosophila guanche]